MALTNAQKQARWRERRQAELQALREQAATLKADPDLDPSGLDTRAIAVHDIAVWPSMPLPEAERLQELEQAMRAGADVFLVPGDNEREARRHAGGLRVIAVNSFRQALRALATLETTS